AGWFTVGPGRSTPVATSAGAPDRADLSDDVIPLQAAEAHTGAQAADRSDRAELSSIPGLGPSSTSRIPAETRQLLVVPGKGKDSSESTVTQWTRGDDGHWQA